MCRHRQIKQPAFGLASSLFLIWCLCDFLCTCLIQKEGISIISEQLHCWQTKVKHSLTPHTQTRSQHHKHLWIPSATEPFPSYLEASKYRGYSARTRNSGPTLSASVGFTGLRERRISHSILKAYWIWLVYLWWVFFFYICVCSILGLHGIGILSNQTPQSWGELWFRVDFISFPEIVSDIQKSTGCVTLSVITSIVHSSWL